MVVSMAIRVEELAWDEENEGHIWTRHQVDVLEVEEAVIKEHAPVQAQRTSYCPREDGSGALFDRRPGRSGRRCLASDHRAGDEAFGKETRDTTFNRKEGALKMAKRIPEFKGRKEEAAYWDSESVAEHLEEMERVEAEVTAPLSHTLSVRVSGEDLRKLRVLARTQGVGLTTMARMLLKRMLNRPDQQLLQALDEREGREEMVRLFNDAKVPPGEEEPTLFVISQDRLQELDRLIREAVEKMLLELVKGGARVSPQSEIYEDLEHLVRR